MLLLFAIHISSANPDIYEKPGEYSFSLSPGMYTIECFGAQGGGANHVGDKISMQGGKGAHVKGVLMITGEPKQFYAFVGGEGTSSEWGPNKGGFNGGGNGGKDTESHIFNGEAPGGGGGASDIRYKGKEYYHRVMVAAGGSGATHKCPGAPGGCLTGYKYASNENYVKDESVSQKTGRINGSGGNGVNSINLPSSGGGGGYMGGYSYDPVSDEKDSWSATASSGSSYISGYSGCTSHYEITFTMGQMEEGVQEHNGSVIVYTNFTCQSNCFSCSSQDKCTKCKEGYVLYQNTCSLASNVPTGYININDSFVKCKSPCETCTESQTKCQTCQTGYFLYGTECIQHCPDGFYESTADKKCIKCSEKCKLCDSSLDNCYLCTENYILYNNQCISQCPSDAVRSGNTCQKCHSTCKTCSPSPTDCTSCQDNLYLHEGKCIESCPNKFYGNDKGQCIDCPAPCETCDSPENCFSCQNNYYLHDGKCIIACPPGTTQSGSICL